MVECANRRVGGQGNIYFPLLLDSPHRLVQKSSFSFTGTRAFLLTIYLFVNLFRPVAILRQRDSAHIHHLLSLDLSLFFLSFLPRVLLYFLSVKPSHRLPLLTFGIGSCTHPPFL